MNIYPENLPSILGFESILHQLIEYCEGAKAKEIISKLKPTTDFDSIHTQLEETSEYIVATAGRSILSQQQYPEMDSILHLLKIKNAVLTTKQCVQIKKKMVLLFNEIIYFFHDKKELFPHLTKKIEPNKKDEIIIQIIDEIVDKDGIIRDSASTQLLHIRTHLRENRKLSDRIYKTCIERLRKNGHLADVEESFINGRRVVGVFSEFKRELKGIILGQSASGKITYIEPQNLINLNNEKNELESEEKKEIYKILKEATEKISPYKQQLSNYYLLVIDFDLLNAKARLAKLLRANKPYIQNQEQKIHLQQAYHPVLYLQNFEKKIQTVPFDATFDEHQRIMVISGPNAGGKSITLKTIALLQMMFQCGLFITVHPKSEMSIMQNILGDIGDNQSIEDGLSTYSSRLLKMKFIFKNAKEKSLFVIDEFGTGSDPDMGGALAEVILNKLNDRKCFGVITTHFTNLKLLANHQQGVFNACMLFNIKTLKPLYQLQIGEPGSSFTFEVAEKTGIDKEIINAAKSKLSKERVQMDSLLNQLQIEKKQIAQTQKKNFQKQISKTTAAKREFNELNEQLENSILRQKQNKEEKTTADGLWKKATSTN
ncbi:MAG: DNA mismatch repair protein MutS domain-containing protein [Bacteroidetes bacterium OLB11]|nr:MAG: DNA mismatch repair protein MutS domain-containing protein [Bacteroidetes bacterium OLB11]